MKKGFKELDKSQAKLFTKSENYAKHHNGGVDRLVSMGRMFVENEPEFELKVLDNSTLTKICMALERRTTVQLKRIKELEKDLAAHE